MTKNLRKRWQKLAGILTEATHTINDDDDFAGVGIRFDPEKEDLSVRSWDSDDSDDEGDSVIDLIDDAEKEWSAEEAARWHGPAGMHLGPPRPRRKLGEQMHYDEDGGHRTEEMLRRQVRDLVKLDGWDPSRILELVREAL